MRHPARGLLAARLHGRGAVGLRERLLGPPPERVARRAAESRQAAARLLQGALWISAAPRAPEREAHLALAARRLEQAEPRVRPQAQERAEAAARELPRVLVAAEVPERAPVRAEAEEARFRQGEPAPPVGARVAHRAHPRPLREHPCPRPGRVRQDRLAPRRLLVDRPVRLLAQPAQTAPAASLQRLTWRWRPAGWRPRQAKKGWWRMSRDVSPVQTAIERGVRA